MSSGEYAIREAVQEVEAMGADVRLTQAVILLGEAKDKVADFVDGIPGSDVQTFTNCVTVPEGSLFSNCVFYRNEDDEDNDTSVKGDTLSNLVCAVIALSLATAIGMVVGIIIGAIIGN
jgi:hypothetical protein